jgi:hypothetical protein
MFLQVLFQGPWRADRNVIQWIWPRLGHSDRDPAHCIGHLMVRPLSIYHLVIVLLQSQLNPRKAIQSELSLRQRRQRLVVSDNLELFIGQVNSPPPSGFENGNGFQV